MDIRTYLKQGKPLLFDGAMGTWFAARPGRAEEPCEQANLTHPEEIAAIHRAYLEAGCRAIKTNTFAAGGELAGGREEQAEKVIRAACRLALDAARPYDAWVFADLGPAPQGKELRPAENYRRQAELFLEQGVTHFLAETLPSDKGIPELARYLKEACPSAFLIVSYAVGFDGATRDGCPGGELFRRTAALKEVDAVGFNCVSGPHHLLEYIRKLELDGVTLSVMPNAGYPTVLGRRTVFQGTPDYFGEKLAQIAQAGAAIVGGCCGTTPEHIAKAAAALERRRPIPMPARPAAGEQERRAPGRNSLAEKLDSGRRVIAVELDPPVDDNVAPFLEGVRVLRDALPGGRPGAAGRRGRRRDHRGLPGGPSPGGQQPAGLQGAAGAGRGTPAPHDLPGPESERHQGAAAGAVHGGRPQRPAGHGRPHPHRGPQRGQDRVQLQLPEAGPVCQRTE